VYSHAHAETQNPITLLSSLPCIQKTQINLSLLRGRLIDQVSFWGGCAEYEEIKALLEVGFEYVCQKDGLIFLRKRK